MKIPKACSNANHICDKTQYKEATFWEMIKLNIHLIYCRACRKYTSRNKKLTNTIKSAEIKSICKEDKEILKEKLHQEMIK